MEGWHRLFVHPHVVLCAGGHAQYPAFAPDRQFFASNSSEMAVGGFFVIVSFGPTFAPTVRTHRYLYCHIVSSYFVAHDEVCPGANFIGLQ